MKVVGRDQGGVPLEQLLDSLDICDVCDAGLTNGTPEEVVKSRKKVKNTSPNRKLLL